MADHKSYMHPFFPSSSDNEHTPHLKHLHNVTHEDPHLRQRNEPTGHGGMSSADGPNTSVGKGTY